MNKLLYGIVLFFSFIIPNNAIQGQVKKAVPLKEVLTELEQRYSISFSFEDTTIKGISIQNLATNLTLEVALNTLRKRTKLEFRVLSERFIAISTMTNRSLTKVVQQLEEVVVQNYLSKGLSKTSSGSVDFKKTSFTIFPGLIEPDILQIVQKLPSIISVEERISDINIRGGTSDQNLILYEGIRMYQSGHFFGLISAFNPYLSEKVTISKNGTSAKYGDGVSGLISIQNSDDIDNTFKGGVGLNLLSVDGFSKIPISKKAELQLAARRSLTDVFTSATYDAYFNRIFRDSNLNSATESTDQSTSEERFLFYDINAKFLYDINKSSKLRITFLTLSNNLNYNQIFSTSNTAEQERKSALNQLTYGMSTTYSKLWHNGIRTSLQAYYSNYNLDADNNNITNSQRLIQENNVVDFGLRFDAAKKIIKSMEIKAGYQFNEVSVTSLEDVSNPDFKRLIKEVIRVHAVFSELEWTSKSRKSYLRFGARLSYFEKLSKLTVEPRLAFNQKFLNNFRLEILGELKSQSLTQIVDLQQDFFGIEKRRWQLANGIDVPLISSQQASIGLSYNTKGWLISLEAYYKHVNDIRARSQGFQNQFRFASDVGDFTITGIDILVSKRFKQCSTWLGYTYSHNNYTFNVLNDGNTFANTLDLRHVANASLTYNWDAIKFGLGINWHSGRAYTAPEAFQNNTNTSIEYEAPNSSRLPSYFRTDISVLYNFNFSNATSAEIGLSVWNLFNQTNIINRYYALDENNSLLEINNRSLEFTPNLSLRLNF